MLNLSVKLPKIYVIILERSLIKWMVRFFGGEIIFLFEQ